MKISKLFKSLLFILVFLLASSATFALPPMWPMQKGMRWESSKHDSAVPQNNWTVRSEVLGTVTLDSQNYYNLGIWNYEEGSFDIIPFRSTDSAVYMYEGASEQMVFQIAPVGTIWSYPHVTGGGSPGNIIVEIISIETVTVPFGTFDNTYVYEKYFDPDNPAEANSPIWREYVVPGLGMIKEVDWYRDNPPSYSELTWAGIVKDDVIIDFGPGIGIWARYNDSTWTKLHSLSSYEIVTGDIDGNGEDDVIIDFGTGVGIWVWKNNSSWVKLHSSKPDAMVIGDIDGSGQDDVIINFGPGVGVWVWKNNTTWAKLHPTSPDYMVTGDIDGSGEDDVIIDFGASGIWVWKNNSSWVKLHSSNPVGMVTGNIDGTGGDDVGIDFGPGVGIWVWKNNTTWTKLHSLSVENGAVGDIDGSGQDDLILDFGTSGIWIWKNNSTWVKLHSSNPEDMIIADMDGTGKDEVIIDFGPGTGIWVRYNDSTWTKLHANSFEEIATGNIDCN